jgi:hypothetical protein
MSGEATLRGVPLLSSVGRVKRQRNEAALGHGLRVQAGGLFLHGTERAADGQRRELATGVLRLVQVASQGDAVAVLEGDLLMLNFVALGKHLVPLR